MLRRLTPAHWLTGAAKIVTVLSFIADYDYYYGSDSRFSYTLPLLTHTHVAGRAHVLFTVIIIYCCNNICVTMPETPIIIFILHRVRQFISDAGTRNKM